MHRKTDIRDQHPGRSEGDLGLGLHEKQAEAPFFSSLSLSRPRSFRLSVWCTASATRCSAAINQYAIPLHSTRAQHTRPSVHGAGSEQVRSQPGLAWTARGKRFGSEAHGGAEECRGGVGSGSRVADRDAVVVRLRRHRGAEDRSQALEVRQRSCDLPLAHCTHRQSLNTYLYVDHKQRRLYLLSEFLSVISVQMTSTASRLRPPRNHRARAPH